MAFANYWLKVGTYTIPESFMQPESLQILLSTSDLDSYRDANGVLHRNALEHKIAKVEFNVPPMEMKKFQAILKNIQSQYISSTEKNLLMTAYIVELDDYVSGTVYVPDITTKIHCKNIKGEYILDATRIAFIEY